MFLFITTINQQACWQDFLCQISDLEQAFDFLDLIVINGDTLVKAQLVDQGSKLDLPAEAFDGEPVGEHLVRLQGEWERLLVQTINRPEKSPVTHELHQRLLMARRTKEENLHRKLTMMQYLFESAQQNLPEGIRKERLLRHYQLIIDQTVDSLRELHGQFAARPVS